MNPTDDKGRLDAALLLAASLIEKAPDSEVPALLGDGILDRFMMAIAKPKVPGAGTPYDYLLSNKHRLQIIALIRIAITRNYPVRATVGEVQGFVSPSDVQWYPDGVMFVQGTEPFTGLIGLFQNGLVKFAISARNAQRGETLGKEDFIFIDAAEASLRSSQPIVPRTEQELDAAVRTLSELISSGEGAEDKYQQYFAAHPWVFGTQYNRVDSHKVFDDRNIPDFTAVRVHDQARDVIEIKPPTLSLFQSSGSLRAEFNNTWNQVERYLDFARREADYLLRQKGLYFDNPYGCIIAGYNLTDEQRKAIRVKERLNPAIRFYTYNDVLAMASETVRFIKQIRQQGVEQSHAGDGAVGAAP